MKLFLVGLAIIAAVSADVSHLKEANNDSAQNGYNYDAPSSSFNDNNAVLPENDYLPPTGSPAAPAPTSAPEPAPAPAPELPRPAPVLPSPAPAKPVQQQQQQQQPQPAPAKPVLPLAAKPVLPALQAQTQFPAPDVQYTPTQYIHQESVEYVQRPQYVAPQPQYVAPQQYIAPQAQYVAPQQYIAPQAQYIAPQPQYVASQQYIAPQAQYIAPQAQYVQQSAALQHDYLPPVSHSVYQAPAIHPAPVYHQAASIPLAAPAQVIPSHTYSAQSGYTYNVPHRR